MKTSADVVNAYLNYNFNGFTPCGTAEGNVSFSGAAFVSYHTIVARAVPEDGAVLVTSNRYSVTTTRHCNALRHACARRGIAVRDTDDVLI